MPDQTSSPTGGPPRPFKECFYTVMRALKDDSVKAKLFANPKGEFDADNVPYPKSKRLVMVEVASYRDKPPDTRDILYLPFPKLPGNLKATDLSDDELRDLMIFSGSTSGTSHDLCW